MKYIKKFENIEGLSIGDYVLCRVNRFYFSDLDDFVQKNVGKIIESRPDNDYVVEFDVKLNHSNLRNYAYSITSKNLKIKFDKKEIKEFSKDKEKLISMLTANKYNL